MELDEYACYVIADGITELAGTESARLAIETVILYFQANPSMSGRSMRRLIAAADRALIGYDSYTRQEASLTVILTDYRSFRYGYLGNTRMRMYRGGRVFRQTEDMSLAQEFVEQEKIARDVLQEHEERNNLYAYLGQGGARPFVSKKIKLLDTDIITLYTRGIWENLDEAELDDVFYEAGNEVQDSLDNVEELLLSRQPRNLENYTFAAIFANKVYSDPARAKKAEKDHLVFSAGSNPYHYRGLHLHLSASAKAAEDCGHELLLYQYSGIHRHREFHTGQGGMRKGGRTGGKTEG